MRGEPVDLVTLLGIAPDRTEPGYRWIEPGDPVAGADGSGLREVRRFWEKPAEADPERFHAQDWLWNSFVMVGRVSTLLAVVRLTAPDLYRSFAEIRPALGPPLPVRVALAGSNPAPATKEVKGFRELLASP